MTKQKAPAAMIAAVRSVRASERLSAIRFADRFFTDCLSNQNFSEEFRSDAERRAMAAEATAAEVRWRFA